MVKKPRMVSRRMNPRRTRNPEESTGRDQTRRKMEMRSHRRDREEDPTEETEVKERKETEMKDPEEKEGKERKMNSVMTPSLLVI